MTNPPFYSITLLFLVYICIVSPVLCGESQTYIIAVKRPSNLANITTSRDALINYYKSFLPRTTAAAGDRQIHAYQEVFSGFAARLTPQELQNHVATKEGFLDAYPDSLVPLLTTHTPDFLHLRAGGPWSQGNLGQGVIIGVIDSGFTPGHPSFDDRNMPPPPSKWKGYCPSHLCNNKVIGVRYSRLAGSAVDNVGHGTHTASTAAGASVYDAEVFGQARGTASGIAPFAHLAIYKACDDVTCSVKDIIMAIEAAVADGVDVISMSMGISSSNNNDPIAIAMLAAVERGITVSAAACNAGPRPGSLCNDAPWMLTVAASTIDRSLRAIVKLPDRQPLIGESLVQPPNFPEKPEPLVAKENCKLGDLTNVQGRIVFCRKDGKDIVPRLRHFGALAVIIASSVVRGATIDDLIDHALPTIRINASAGRMLLNYIDSARRRSRATLLFKGTVLGPVRAPVIGSFSSRGPSLRYPFVLKPDITGPGVNILAAWPFDPTTQARDMVSFNIMSGTSMSTPHLAGVIALVKHAHMDWSPAAIKSAIMTTSYITDNMGDTIKTEKLMPAVFFDMGSGHVNPSGAIDPGLVYDEKPDMYVPFLCGLNYTDKEVSIFARRNVECEVIGRKSQEDLNYPAIAVYLPVGGSRTVIRRVTNVSPAGVWRSSVDKLPGVKITVVPETLEFSKEGETNGFTVTFQHVDGGGGEKYVEGNLLWISGKYVVRSPLVVELERNQV